MLRPFVSRVLKSRRRGSTRLTLLLARHFRTLQAVPVRVGGRTLFADLRLVSTHGLLSGKMAPTGEDLVMRRIVRAGDTVYDIGAHMGYFTVVLSELVGPAGRVYAFEPNPSAWPSLLRTAESCGNVVLERFALSDENAESTLVIPADPTMASLADWTGGQSSRAACSVRRLDDLNLPAPDFIKCDVEGAEPAAFNGAAETIRRHAPVVMFEANVNTATGFGREVDEAMLLFAGMGYELFAVQRDGRLEPVAPHKVKHANILAVPPQRRDRL